MTTKAHKKHSNLPRPPLGYFHRNEWAIMGAPCDIIQSTALQIATFLKGKLKLAYIDTDHASFDQPKMDLSPFDTLITDFQNHIHVEQQSKFNKYDWIFQLSRYDAVLVNGNHHFADKQLVLLHPAKKASLIKNKDRLTQIEFFIDCHHESSDIRKALIKENPNWQNIPTISWDNLITLGEYIQKSERRANKTIKGLILNGGKSQRMGKDKGSLKYRNNKSQVHYLYDLLTEELSIPAYQSISKEAINGNTMIPIIEDKYQGLGPFGGILSAFQHDPNASWFVVACDLPMLKKEDLQYLLDHRNTSKYATAFFNKATGWPDPLFTIWEKRAYSRLLQFLSLGYSCPRKVLINSDIELIQPNRNHILFNANFPDDQKWALKLISNE